jgi:type IV pilus assembly protein PilW
MRARDGHFRGPAAARGLSLIEMMVTVVIGAILMIGVIAIFGQTRTTYRTNDTVERMQENARFALATLEPDIRLARNWGMHSVDAKVIVPPGVQATCADGTDVSAWVLDPTRGVQAANDDYATLVPCPAFGDDWLDGTDVLVVRHASGQPSVPAAGVVQIQSDRTISRVFDSGVAPAPAAGQTFDWQTNVYYVAGSSSLGDGVPSLRRLTLVGGVLQDQELVPGVEDFQLQLGVDTDNDNVVERYVEADHGLVTPGDAAFDDDAKILAVRVWLLFRAEQAETGFVDGANYNYADVADFAPADGFRRALVNKTILLRNFRGNEL